MGLDIKKLVFDKKGLIPAIVQDSRTLEVLMLGYMNVEAIELTVKNMQVTFYSRSKKRLWVKGETSGHVLDLVSIAQDCDSDALLIQAIPHGPTCHKGTITCWGESQVKDDYRFIQDIEQILADRKVGKQDGSYVQKMYKKGINKIAQKVGEEATEFVIEAVKAKHDKSEYLGEAADLLFHYLMALHHANYRLSDVVDVLEQRHKPKVSQH